MINMEVNLHLCRKYNKTLFHRQTGSKTKKHDRKIAAYYLFNQTHINTANFLNLFIYLKSYSPVANDYVI